MRSLAPELTSTRGAALLLFAVLATLYLASVGMRASRSASITGDEPFYLATTQSLIEDGNLDLREQYASESYRSFFDHADGLWYQSAPLEDGRVLSPHSPGLSVLLIPGFAAGGLLGAQVELLLITAATFALAFVLIVRELGHPRLAWSVTAAVGLSAPAFVYATEIYPEVPAAACVVISLLVLRGRRGVRQALVLVALVTALTWLGPKYAPLGLVLAGAYLWQTGNPRERAWFVGAGIASAALYVWAQFAWFGSLTPYSTNLVYEGASTASVVASHLSLEERTYRLWGLFIDQRFGIARWAPIFLVVWPALPLLPRAGRVGGVVAALIGTQLLVAVFVSVTMMGWWFPGRTLIVVFPLFAFALTLAAVELARRVQPRIVWSAATVLAAYSLGVTGALVHASRSEVIRIAVDPFAMPAWLFRATEPLYPNYTWWGHETVMLNAAWLTLGLAAVVLVTWRTYRGRLTERLRGWRTPPSRMTKPA